ncbi:MAG: hypothetical protein HC919_13695 [Oscillatoriales cyanobacterium SM2_2_1]|nr:hypothetical protein [Oscillatoriales cyanobacterium SM2_2_1]
MELRDIHHAKLEPQLAQVLQQASPDQRLQALMLLASSPLPAPPHPREFPNYETYRSVVQHQQNEALKQDVAETLRSLRELNLSVQGGNLTPVVVVEGNAADLVKSLELKGVLQARTNSPLQLIFTPS